MNNKGVSVIICCFNSSLRIQKTLNHLISQEFESPINWEIIIVDNNSSDNTKEICTQILKSSFINYKILTQPLPGLSHARKKGVDNAQYTYIIFCDDDNWLNTNYVQNVFNVFTTHHEYHILGGHGFPASDKPFPEWFESHKYCFAVGDQSNIGPTKKTVYGAGIAFRLDCFKKLKQIGFENIITGRIGKKMLSGEDTELCWVLFLLGFQLHVPITGLEFQHFIPEKKLTLGHLKDFYFGNGYSAFYTSCYEDIIIKNTRFVNNYPTWLIKRILYQMKSLINILFSKNKVLSFYHWKGYTSSLLKNGKLVNQQTKFILNIIQK